MTKKPMLDDELSAMKKISKFLDALSVTARDRVLSYITKKYDPALNKVLEKAYYDQSHVAMMNGLLPHEMTE